MSINVLRYEYDGCVAWGVVRDGGITTIPESFATTADLVREANIAEWKALQGERISIGDVKLLSPVTANQQFLCQGANYRQHMIESGVDPDTKSFNMIFRKASSCMVGANSDVLRPAHVQFLDYEIELGLVLKRDVTSAQTVRKENLHKYIAGIVIVNDYSARGVQIPEMQFYKGKSYRTFGPVGPWLCLLEEGDIGCLETLELCLRVNGEPRQQDSTSNMVYSPAETLTELSGLQDLLAGDLIATGTPAGCALSVPSPIAQRFAALLPEANKWKLFKKMQGRRAQYLNDGDLVEACIRSKDGAIDLGVQRNRIVGVSS